MSQRRTAQRGRGGGRRSRRRGDRDREDSEFIDKLVSINRVAKVVKGGRRFGFAALVVVGDGKGRVGYGAGKAREVPEAIRKATEQAQAQHDPRAAARRPHAAPRHRRPLRRRQGGPARGAAGTGIIAGGPMRAVFEALGMQDVVAKSLGTSNPHNMVKATFAALEPCRLSPRSVAARRGKKVDEILGRAAMAAEARE